jgi:hypothetical protein
MAAQTISLPRPIVKVFGLLVGFVGGWVSDVPCHVRCIPSLW